MAASPRQPDAAYFPGSPGSQDLERGCNHGHGRAPPDRQGKPHQQLHALPPPASYKTLETWLIRVTALTLLILPIWMLSPPSIAKQDLILTSILVGCFMSLSLYARPDDVHILAGATAYAAVLMVFVQLRQPGG